jgi:hypothetical protein
VLLLLCMLTHQQWCTCWRQLLQQLQQPPSLQHGRFLPQLLPPLLLLHMQQGYQHHLIQQVLLLGLAVCWVAAAAAAAAAAAVAAAVAAAASAVFAAAAGAAAWRAQLIQLLQRLLQLRHCGLLMLLRQQQPSLDYCTGTAAALHLLLGCLGGKFRVSSLWVCRDPGL